jgi:hypothetical protein
VKHSSRGDEVRRLVRAFEKQDRAAEQSAKRRARSLAKKRQAKPDPALRK